VAKRWQTDERDFGAGLDLPMTSVGSLPLQTIEDREHGTLTIEQG
jgi:hypothetical protein